jgi:hypothetical protein
MKRLTYCLTLCCFAALPVHAQLSSLTGFAGAGVSVPVQDIGSRLDSGWNFAAGVGPKLGRYALQLDFLYNDSPINHETLETVPAPNGTMRMFAFTLDPVVHLNATGESHFDFYLTAGGGIYHRTVEFTQPVLVPVTLYDPFFGIIFPVTTVGSQVISSRSNLKGGVDVGGGISWRVGESRVKVFAETRYHHMYTRPTPTTILPVTFGFRW